MSRRSEFTEAQIVWALKQAELGTPLAEVTRKLGVSEQTFYAWKKRYSGMDTAGLRELWQLQEENRKLKQMVADLRMRIGPGVFP